MHNIALITLSEEEFRSIIAAEVEAAMKRTSEAFIPQSEPNHDKLLTREETAEMLHVSLLTLHKYTKDGTLKPMRIGRRVLYRYGEILEMLDRRSGK